MEPIMKYAELEEQEGDDQRYDDTDRYHFHRQILLRTYGITLHSVSFSFQLVRRQAYGSLDDSPRVDDADHPGGSDTSDTDVAGVGGEDLLGAHAPDGRRDSVIAERKYVGAENGGHGGDDPQPYQE